MSYNRQMNDDGKLTDREDELVNELFTKSGDIPDHVKLHCKRIGIVIASLILTGILWWLVQENSFDIYHGCRPDGVCWWCCTHPNIVVIWHAIWGYVVTIGLFAFILNALWRFYKCN